MTLRISRRYFLAGALLAPAGVASYLCGPEAVGATRGALESAHAWEAAALDNEGFLAEKGSVFTNVLLGCSFAPEQWTEAELADGQAMQGLRFCVEELGLKEMRLGLRWDRIEQPDGSIDLAAYRPYLDYCFQHNLSVCLNIGPMRTFRWPEDRAPAHVLSSLDGLPDHGDTIDWGSPLAEAAVAYMHRLLDALLSEYGDEMQHLSSVQPENESFQGFDERSWPVTSRYMRNVIYEIDRRLPAVPILVTSAGRPRLAQITNLYKDLLRSDGARFRNRLISGFDYYYATPRHDRVLFHHYLDPIALAFQFPTSKTCAENIDDSRAVGFRIEVSEGQAEPYAHIREPGNSAEHFRFMLLRCAEKALDPREKSVLRIWGVEELAKKARSGQITEEHRQIFDLIGRLGK